jgi:predicted enzyme related to lactoylglutathione lyase
LDGKLRNGKDHLNIGNSRHEPGIDGGLAKRSKAEESLTPSIKVDDYASKIEANGGKVIQSRTVIPGVGYMLVFKDTENNRLGLMEEDQSAK